MATWCETCKGELPQLARLRRSFSPEDLALIGVPVDEDDDIGALRDYRERHAPAYVLLDPLSESQHSTIREIVQEGLWVDTLPATIVTDGGNRVLHVQAGVPSVSQVRRWLRGARR